MHTHTLVLQRRRRIAAGLWVWFACGCAALLLVPALRGRDPTFGWLAYWCVLAPLIDLLVLHRTRWLPAGVFLRTSVIAGVKQRTSMRALLEKRGYYRGKSCARRVKARRRQHPHRRALLAALFNP